MNISPINSSPNFTGLWGAERKEQIFNDKMYLTLTSKSYYPFKAEPAEEIEKIKQCLEKECALVTHEIDGTTVQSEIEFRVHKPLEFSEQEFVNYQKSKIGAKSPQEVTHPIEKQLVERKLFDYLNFSDEYVNELTKQKSLKYKMQTFFNKFRGRVL